jgi:chemotaxis protein CheZ
MEEEIISTLSKLMLEGEFYKNINPELQNGLTKFYKDINSANKEAGSGVSIDQKKTEASEQLDALKQTT